MINHLIMVNNSININIIKYILKFLIINFIYDIVLLAKNIINIDYLCIK